MAKRVERLKEKGATTIYSRANNPDGTGRHHGLLTYMGFYDLLPTVQTQGLKVCDENGKTQFMDLDLLPTPEASMWKDQTITESTARMGDLHQMRLPRFIAQKMRDNGDFADNVGKTSHLSPLFTEEMMGFPLMWTTLPFLSDNGEQNLSKPTEMQSSHK